MNKELNDNATSSILASGIGSIAIEGGVDGSTISTFVVQGDVKVELSPDQLAALNNTIVSDLPSRLHNLPQPDRFFEGRDAQLAELVSHLAGGNSQHASITALRGIGGIGKTELAAHAATALMPKFPDAQILINLRGTSEQPMPAQEAMENIIRRFHPTDQLPDDAAEIVEIYREVLRGKRAVIVLDNARDTAHVSELLPPSPSCGIVTSRNVLHLPGGQDLRLDCLEREASIAVLAGHLADRAPERDELDALAEACLDHPLSLHVAGSYLARMPMAIETYCTRIAENRGALKLKGMPNTDVMAVLDLSVQMMAAEDATLVERWRELTVFPADFDAAAAAAIWAGENTEPDAAAAEDVLLNLHGFGLVESGMRPGQRTASRAGQEMGHDGRFHLHDMIRALAVFEQPEDGLLPAQMKHAQYFLELLGRANELYREGGAENAVAGLALYDREADNIAAGRATAVRLQADMAPLAQLVAVYPNAGVHVLALRLHGREYIIWLEDAVAACREIGDRQAEGSVLGNLGNAYLRLGDVPKAIEHYEAALEISREIGDRQGEGNRLGNLGLAYLRLGDVPKAIEHYDAALEIAREIGDRQGEGNSLGNLGSAFARLGELPKAIEFHEAALEIAREIGDRQGEGNHLGNLGLAHARLGDVPKAIEHHEAALEISREIGDRQGEGNHLGNLGNAYLRLGDVPKAIEHHEAALAIFEAIGSPYAEPTRNTLEQLQSKRAFRMNEWMYAAFQKIKRMF